MPGKSPFFSARKPRHKLSAVETPMNLQASLSKLNKHGKKRFAWLLFVVEKPLPVCLKQNMEGKPWCHQSTDTPITLPQSHMMVVCGKYLGFLKIHDVLLQRKESRFIPSVNSENLLMQVTEKALSAGFCCYPPCRTSLGGKGWAGGSALHVLTTGSLPAPICPTCFCPGMSTALHRCQ